MIQLGHMWGAEPGSASFPVALFPEIATIHYYTIFLYYTIQFPEIEKSNPKILLMTLPAIWASLRYKHKRKYKYKNTNPYLDKYNPIFLLMTLPATRASIS